MNSRHGTRPRLGAGQQQDFRVEASSAGLPRGARSRVGTGRSARCVGGADHGRRRAAGYGKTTLLAEWSQRHPSRFAWLSIDRHDNDLGRLASYTAAALDRVDPIGSEVLRPTDGRHSVATVASRVAAAMSGMKQPVVLVFDNLESLHNDECLDTIAELALHLPTGSRLALGHACRTAAPCGPPSCRRRHRRGRCRRARDDGLEGHALLNAAGVQLTDAEIEQLLQRTEGWPVGLYLGALALKAGGSREHAGVPFSGDDTLMAEYLRSELLRIPLGRRSLVPDSEQRARSDEWAALRCGARQRRLGRAPGVARAVELVARRTRSARTVVPIPSPVTRPTASRARSS